MNIEPLTRLAERAGDVTGRADDRLTEVRSRIRTHRRRRTAGAVVGAAALVVAVVAGATLLTGSPDPAPDPAPAPNRVDSSPESVRPLTWTDEFWPSRRIHYGDRVIDTRLDRTKYDFAGMDLTDDGVVVTTVDGRVWLADTTSVRRIATTGVSHSFLGILDVRTGNAGSLAAWITDPGSGDAAIVVYDTARERVVARHRCDLVSCQLRWVGTDSVYWDAYGERPRRLDVTTGEMTVVRPRTLVQEVLGLGRALVVGGSFEGGKVTNGLDVTFVREGTHLRAAVPGTTVPGRLTTAFATTGTPVRLRVPEGYDRARSFTAFQWLDDDRLALMAGAGMGYVPGLPDSPVDSTGYGDILVCQVSTGACRLAARGPGEPQDNNGDQIADDNLRIVPHFGTIGTN